MPGPKYFEQRRTDPHASALKAPGTAPTTARITLPPPPVRAKGPSLMRRLSALAPTGSDKLVHIGVFAVPTAAGLLAGIHPAAVIAPQLIAAPTTEWLQEEFIVGRGGSGKDVAADLAGITLGVMVAAAVTWRRATPRK